MTARASDKSRPWRSSLARIADACYASVGTEHEWLEGIVNAVGPIMDLGLSVAAWTFRLEQFTPVETVAAANLEVIRVLQQTSAESPPDEAWRFLLGRRAKSASERLHLKRGLASHPAFESIRQHQLEDFSALTVYDVSGVGVALAAPSRQVFHTSRLLGNRLERIGAHLLAGFRLRRGLTPVDAVLAPDGRLLDATGDARTRENGERLQQAVKAFDRACSRRPSDPDEALRGWQALVSGRWSIVQSFESDGRRYLLARRNAPGSIERAALSHLEAHALILRAQGLSFKMVAYELGVSNSVVYQLVQSGKKKLGINNEAELPAMMRSTLLRGTGKPKPA